MNIQSDKLFTIFAKDFEGKYLYRTSISRKMQEGKYDNAYIDVRFKQGEQLENKSRIYIKNGFLTFYRKKDNTPVFYIMVLDYEKVEETIEQSKDIVKQETKDNFKEFGREVKLNDIEILDSDLPF